MREKVTQHNSGFALLLTLIVVSVVLSIGLSLLDITLKQLVLSGTARDSEIAFDAAYAGVECAEYWVRDDYTQFVGSARTLPRCIKDDINGTYDEPKTDVHRSVYEIDWGTSGEERCTQFDVFILDAKDAGGDVDYDFDANNYGYPAGSCTEGSVCTYIFARGYNRACNDTNSMRTVQREVVSKF